MLAEIEGVVLSTGTISGYITATADHSDWDILSIQDGEPMILDLPPDLRGYRCSVESPRDVPDTEYHRQDAILTQRSNLWTSFQSQPAIVRIVKGSPMEYPHVIYHTLGLKSPNSKSRLFKTPPPPSRACATAASGGV